MAPDDSLGMRSGGTGLARRFVLELVICRSEPLSGQVGLAGIADRISFRGWIDLMSAVHTLCGDGQNPPAPS